MSHRNLACMRANFRQADADRLIFTRVPEKLRRSAEDFLSLPGLGTLGAGAGLITR